MKQRLLNFCPHVIWVLFFGMTVGVCVWPIWGLEEVPKHSDSPERLEQELRYLLSIGRAESQDPAELRHLATLYLDLGYGLYLDPAKKLFSFQEGARLAKLSLEQEESSADAHFLYAANLGKAVQLQGVVAAVLALQTLKTHVNRVLELDEKHAPAHHILGRIYEELPWFLGGDPQVAGDHLKQAISLDPHYAPGRLDLGKWYLKHGNTQEALLEFVTVIETPPLEKQWIWERIHQPQARKMLRQIRESKASHFPSAEGTQ